MIRPTSMRYRNRLLESCCWTLVLLTALAELAWAGTPCARAGSALQEAEVSPEAAPEIRQIKPDGAAPGSEVTIVIEGRSFSRGAYVSFSNPTLHVLSTRRVSDTRLETRVAIAKKAPPGTVTLYVSNPAGSVAEVAFTVAAGTGAAAPAAVAAPSVPSQPTEAVTPEVTVVEPPRASRGSQLDVQVRGKNFAPGAKIAFSNPGIRVLETVVSKSTELTARIQIAADAETGSTGLFVVNPDDRETEVAFEVTQAVPTAPAGAATTPPTAPAAAAPPAPPAPPATTSAAPAAAPATRFEVINLGEGIDILQNVNKARGTLTLSPGKLKYEESGKEVFSAGPGDIKEIDANTILGVNTGTFHVILSSGKTFNFAPASLRPADSQTILESLRGAVK